MEAEKDTKVIISSVRSNLILCQSVLFTFNNTAFMPMRRKLYSEYVVLLQSEYKNVLKCLGIVIRNNKRV